MKLEINKDWKFKEVFPSISAYTYVYNAAENGYPFEKAIKSFASWVDEVVVVNANHKDDGTSDKLSALQEKYQNIQVQEVPMDLEEPGKDGQTKALARAMCTSEFVIQFDADEICMGDPYKWKKICKNEFQNTDILNLFVAEPVGCLENLKYTKEHNPSKWRIYLNKPEITHNIPDHDRLEKNGKVYSKGGSDGCFPTNIVDNSMYPSKDHESVAKLKEFYAKKDNESRKEYAKLVKEILKNDDPYVLHLGHVNLKKKIKMYLSDWHTLWCHLYDKDPDDPQNNIFFPGKSPSEVTEKEIEHKVYEISNNTDSIVIPELRKKYDDQQK